MKKITALMVITILFLTSCKPIYFTQSMRERVQRTNKKNIEKVQFFNDKKIVLVRKTTSEDEDITGGEVKFKDGFYYYYVTFPKKTPAIAKEYEQYLDKENKYLKVYFESEANSYLPFGKYNDEQYGIYGIQKNDGLYMDFEGKKFKMIEGKGVRLILNRNIDIDIKEKKRKVKGVRVK